MIAFPAGVRVWLATGHTDMRRGFDGLALLVQEQLKRDPHSGQLFVFRGRRGGLIKILWHDGQGLCLFAKRLERGRFIWPSPSAGAVTITAAQLGYLLEGIDCRSTRGVHRPRDNGATNRLMLWIECALPAALWQRRRHATPIRFAPDHACGCARHHRGAMRTAHRCGEACGRG
jgi:transposase